MRLPSAQLVTPPPASIRARTPPWYLEAAIPSPTLPASLYLRAVAGEGWAWASMQMSCMAKRCGVEPLVGLHHALARIHLHGPGHVRPLLPASVCNVRKSGLLIVDHIQARKTLEGAALRTLAPGRCPRSVFSVVLTLGPGRDDWTWDW